jgi:hypothetical protein
MPGTGLLQQSMSGSKVRRARTLPRNEEARWLHLARRGRRDDIDKRPCRSGCDYLFHFFGLHQKWTRSSGRTTNGHQIRMLPVSVVRNASSADYHHQSIKSPADAEAFSNAQSGSFRRVGLFPVTCIADHLHARVNHLVEASLTVLPSQKWT